ncbi:uroporphyrinogen-III synthase [Rhodohalobacter sp. 8-1]|uniref:uroporphyrinogen-III synthase n=1 Tax=Rhodohalobacter sp. 8-1 TaxID=3131972 RepID=UPI0030EBAF5B
MSKGKLLVTASNYTCGDMKYVLEDNPDYFLHIPLEAYESTTEKMASGMLKKNVDNFAFVIYGNLRNAIYFEKWMSKHKLLSDFQNLVHFSLDQPTSEFLESHGIPAIQPRQHAKPIDILEFMLKISREGKTLYPSCSNKAEEMPGLLQELEMDVAEFPVCEEIGLDPEDVESLRNKLSVEKVSAVLFHNRSGVTRTFAAFQDLDVKKLTVYSGSAGVTEHLIGKGIEPHFEAEGSWPSIEELIKSEFLENV